jgi:hypothetical protein
MTDLLESMEIKDAGRYASGFARLHRLGLRRIEEAVHLAVNRLTVPRERSPPSVGLRRCHKAT